MREFEVNGQSVEEYEEDGEVIWKTVIDEPIYGTTVAINKKLLREAHMKDATLEVVVGEVDKKERIAPMKWAKEGEKFEKVFRYPNNPMVMFKRHVGEPTPGDNAQKGLFDKDE